MHTESSRKGSQEADLAIESNHGCNRARRWRFEGRTPQASSAPIAGRYLLHGVGRTVRPGRHYRLWRLWACAAVVAAAAVLLELSHGADAGRTGCGGARRGWLLCVGA